MEVNKFSLIIHGPESDQWLEKIAESAKQFKFSFEKIVVSCYVTETSSYGKKINDFFPKAEVVFIKDLLNPGFFNVNRQVYTVNEALRIISDDNIVFKLRNDQCVDFNKVSKYISDNKILTTNCFTRSDRLYHPSDMFLAGKACLLKKMYSMPLVKQTYFTTQLENVWKCMEEGLPAIPYSPEIFLCKYYIAQCGWKILGTQEDSASALRCFYDLVNSWNIDFKWHKKRSRLFKEDSIILPHYFNMSPFPDAPVERCRCYNEDSFYKKHRTSRDLYFESLAYIDSKMLQFQNMTRKTVIKAALVWLTKKLHIYRILKKILRR